MPGLNFFSDALEAGMVNKPAPKTGGYVPSVISDPMAYGKSQEVPVISPTISPTVSSVTPTDEELKKMIDSGMTDEQILASFAPETPKQEESFLGGALEKTIESAKSGFGRIGEAGVGFAEGKYNLPEAAVRGAAGSLETAFSPFSGVIGQGLQEGVQQLSPETRKSVSEFATPKIQELKQWYGSQTPEQKRRLDNMGVGLEVLTNFIGGKAVQKTGETLATGATTAGKAVSKTVAGTGIKIPKVSEKLAEKGQDFLYEAVNPTTKENKAILRKRVEDLVPYIENNPLKNSLEQVKSRVDIDKNNALDNMKLYEERVGVKGTVETAPIKKKLEDEFIKKIRGVVVNEDDAKIANEMIAKLDELGPTLKDDEIITLRRAWDDVIAKNKGFMMTSEAKTKGDVFNAVNKILREEIRNSNPAYAKLLEQAHRTITLSDVLDATILRRSGQTKGGFIRRGLENTARITGATVGGIPGYLASEALIQGSELVSGAAAKLTAGKLLFNKGKNGIRSNAGGIANNNLPKGGSGLKTPIVKPTPKPTIKKNPVSTNKIDTDYLNASKKALSEWKPVKGGYKISDIDISKTNAFPRAKYHREGYTNTNSYKYWLEQAKNGKKIPPIVVSKTSKGFDVVDGYHRLAAAEDAGIKNIKAIVLDNPIIKGSEAKGLKQFGNFTDSEIENLLSGKPTSNPTIKKNPIKGSIFDLSDKRGSFKVGTGDTGKIVKKPVVNEIKKLNTGEDITLIRGTGGKGSGTGEAIRGKGLYLTDSEDVAKHYGPDIKSVTLKNSDILDGNTKLPDAKNIIDSLPKEMKPYLDPTFDYSYNSLIKTIEGNTGMEAETIAEAINSLIKNKYKGVKFNIGLVNDTLSEKGFGNKNAFVIFDNITNKPTNPIKNSLFDLSDKRGSFKIGLGKTDTESSLIAEAKKFKSAEEFESSLEKTPNIYFHGTNKKFDKFSNDFIGSGEGSSMVGQGVNLTKGKWDAENYAYQTSNRQGGPEIILVTRIKPGLKLYDFDQLEFGEYGKSKEITGLVDFIVKNQKDFKGLKASDIVNTVERIGDDWITAIQKEYGFKKEITDYVKSKGYDGIKTMKMTSSQFGKNKPAENITIFNPDNIEIIKPKDIYNKAHNK